VSENEDLVLQALAEFLNGVEASVQSTRHLLKKVKVEGWDPGKITWKATEGPSGPYERADKQDNTDYQLLLKDLQENDGKMRREGFFYWLFDRQDAVGRKKLN
jgi:hypothetical protein